MNTFIEKFIEYFGWFGMLILSILIIIIHGVVMMLLWDWFVVKTFNLNPLSVLQAFGIVLIFNFLTNQYIPKRNNDEKIESIKENIFTTPAFALVIGFLVHLAMI